MTTQEVANQLTDLCRQGKFLEAIDSFYSKDIVSIEPVALQDGSRETSGFEAVKGKTVWWEQNHEVHGGKVEGPLVAGSHFAIRFTIDATFKPTGVRKVVDEIAVYQVKDGKIAREEFFYVTD